MPPIVILLSSDMVEVHAESEEIEIWSAGKSSGV
jgi:hypothetical protein